MRRVLAVLCLACVVLLADPAAAATIDQRAARIERQVWSPYCPGRLLAECTTQQAERLRQSIRKRLAAGEDDARVRTWLRRNYGEQILAKPRNPALWLLPVAVVLAGAAAWLMVVRRWRHTPEDPPDTQGAPDEWTMRIRSDVEKGI